MTKGRRLPTEQRADLICVAILAVLPVLVFGVPAAAGHPVLNGDNLIQNYPLRYLAGRDISQGHLPLWDPYLWSGSPLLAGFNAGALYPMTALFSVMDPVSAWAVGQIAVYVIASLGLFAFCRSLGLRSLASFLAALSFGFAGAMPAQVVHIGLVEGMCWIPWMMLAMLEIARHAGFPLPPARSSRAGTPRPAVAAAHVWGWVTLLAAAGGMVILSGEPRAMSDAAVVCTVYGLWLAWRVPAGRARFAGLLSLAGVWSVCLGAIQLLPGLQFLHDSQRSAASFASFGAGSLPLPWTLLLVVPDLLGGSGTAGQPQFFGTYQLTEVTAYVGLLPLVAAFALPVASRRSENGGTVIRREWMVWYGVGAVGLVLAWGSNTPLGRALWHLPLYGGQRLQSRNLMIVDLALAVLLAYWVDSVLTPEQRRPIAIPEVDEMAADEELREAIQVRRAAIRRAREIEQRSKWLGSNQAKAISAAPALVGVAACLTALYWGPGFARALSGVDIVAVNRHYRELIPSLGVGLVLCLGAAGIAGFHRSMDTRVRAVVIASFVVVDIVVFTGTTVIQVSAAAISSAKTAVHEAISSVPATPAVPLPGSSAARISGRYAIFDPDLANAYGLASAPQPDLNVLRSLYSVEGYSSIAPGMYADATGSHGQNVISPTALVEGTFDQFDLRYLYTLPRYLLSTSGRVGQPGGQMWQIPPEGVRGWYFGETIQVADIQLANRPSSQIPPGAFAGVEVGLVQGDGTVDWSHDWSLDRVGTGYVGTTSPEEAIGMEVRNLSPAYPATVTDLVVTGANGQRAELQGPLAGFLDPQAWSYDGPAFGYQLYERKLPGATGSVVPLPGGPGAAGAATWKVVSGSIFGSTVTVSVSTPRPATFVRSMGYSPGWRATIETVPDSPGGRPRVIGSVPVTRHGLVQQVTVPAGTHLVEFFYKPATVTVGEIVSGLATLVLLGVVSALVKLAVDEARQVPRRRAYPYSARS